MRAKFIYEKFEEDSDPIIDMGIGTQPYPGKTYKLTSFSALDKSAILHTNYYMIMDDKYTASDGETLYLTFNFCYKTKENKFEIRINWFGVSGYFVINELEPITPKEYIKLQRLFRKPENKEYVKYIKTQTKLIPDFLNVKENMQTPMSNRDRNRPISQKYPLENFNYIGDCADDNKKKMKHKKIKKIMKAKTVKESLNEELNSLGALSIGYLTGFVLSQIFKFIRSKIKSYEEFDEATKTINDLIKLIGKNDSFKVVEFNDRYYITTENKKLQKELGDIRVFKKNPVINVLGHNLVLLSLEHKKLIDLLKTKL